MLSKTKYSALYFVGTEVFYTCVSGTALRYQVKLGNYIIPCFSFCRGFPGVLRWAPWRVRCRLEFSHSSPGVYIAWMHNASLVK